MKKSRLFIGLTLCQFAVLAVLLAYGQIQVSQRERTEIPALQNLVSTLQLTDLSLWTEARYTRHPSQADRFTPFQDFPSALEHFPAGSIMAPLRITPTPDSGQKDS